MQKKFSLSKTLKFGFVLAFFGFSPSISLPCCALTSEKKQINFEDQYNIIVWDNDAKIEHFYRVAQFDTTVKTMSFVAPSPTIPDFGEGDAKALELLASLDQMVSKSSHPGNGANPSASSLDLKVQIVQTQIAAGFEIKTLKSSDATALVAWLKDNNYSVSPGIRKWLDFYINKNWYLSAFKFIEKSPVVKTKMLRMSFKTTQPFNPLYVPQENIGKEAATSNMFFVSDTSYKIDGDHANMNQEPSIRIPDSMRIQLASQLSDKKLTLDSKYLKVSTFFSGLMGQGERDDAFFLTDGKGILEVNSTKSGKSSPLPIAALAVGFFAAYFFLKSRRTNGDDHHALG